MNPFRPCARRYRMPASVIPGWVTNTWKKIELAAKLPGWSGDKDAARMRWAARHACKRLRRRLAEVERERDGLRNQRDDLRDASESWKAEAEAAMQEVARLRDALEAIRSREHSDTCSHSLVPECSCDCHVSIAEAALVNC